MFMNLFKKNSASNVAIMFLIAFFVCNAESKTIIGTATDRSMHVAKEEALRSLASQILTNVNDTSVTYQSDQGQSFYKSTLKIESDIPLFGVENSCEEINALNTCEAMLNGEKVAINYYNQLLSLRQIIDQNNITLKNGLKFEHYSQINKQLALYDQFGKLQLIYNFISDKTYSGLFPKTPSIILEQGLLSLEKNVDSIELAASILTKNIKQENIYIRPPVMTNSNEITPFSESLTDYLNSKTQSVTNLEHAKYIFSGEYVIHDKGIRVSYTLSDLFGQSLSTHIVQLKPKSYAHLRINPLVNEFDLLLNSSRYQHSNNLRVSLQTNKGKKALHFNSGEKVKLQVKTNKPSFLYAVGYIKTEEAELSYLIPLNDGKTDQKFIYEITKSRLNQWIELSNFKITPPFGVESIQVFASKKSLKGALPRYQNDVVPGYAVISDDLISGINLSRSQLSQPNQFSEAALLFTTSK